PTPTPSPVSPFIGAAARRPRAPHSFPTRRSSDLWGGQGHGHRGGRGGSGQASQAGQGKLPAGSRQAQPTRARAVPAGPASAAPRSEEHTSELQSRSDLVCRLLLEKKKNKKEGR